MWPTKTVHDLLVVDSLRGPNSTGVYVVRGDEDHLVKKALLPHELMHFPQFKQAFDKLPDVCIGHNRWATVGDVNARNAHPLRLTTSLAFTMVRLPTGRSSKTLASLW